MNTKMLVIMVAVVSGAVALAAQQPRFDALHQEREATMLHCDERELLISCFFSRSRDTAGPQIAEILEYLASQVCY